MSEQVRLFLATQLNDSLGLGEDGGVIQGQVPPLNPYSKGPRNSSGLPSPLRLPLSTSD